MSIFDQEGLEWLYDTEVYVGPAYLDHGGRWAFGYGHSNLRPFVLNGVEYKEVVEGMHIDLEPAKTLLMEDLEFVWGRLAPHVVPELNPMQKLIVASLGYNTGVSGFKKSDVFAMINNVEKKFNFLYASILMCNYAVTAKDRYTLVRREFAGLKGRRIDEAFYFKRGMNRR